MIKTNLAGFFMALIWCGGGANVGTSRGSGDPEFCENNYYCYQKLVTCFSKKTGKHNETSHIYAPAGAGCVIHGRSKCDVVPAREWTQEMYCPSK